MSSFSAWGGKKVVAKSINITDPAAVMSKLKDTDLGAHHASRVWAGGCLRSTSPVPRPKAVSRSGTEGLGVLSEEKLVISFYMNQKLIHLHVVKIRTRHFLFRNI
ncbi:hypothetical protein EVAR_59443_1 [Eumeta japonica]|uniref:Uncharacterized protein n=1 Tax=Eumeta variegata TaxID=151549 RepID=A0A4C1YY95_EUMVA|nr:hypothetical protein EVAR_59443_1 [Eumeta japonica]